MLRALSESLTSDAAHDDGGRAAEKSAPGGRLEALDWHTPEGLGLWGDGRTFLVGSEGTLELRRTIDASGRGVGGHVFVVDSAGPRYIDVPVAEPPFATQLLADVRDRTETAMSTEHALVVTDLALRGQELALETAGRQEGSLVA